MIFTKGLFSGIYIVVYQEKNEEALAMISLYRHGAPWAKLEAKKWLQKVMEEVLV